MMPTLFGVISKRTGFFREGYAPFRNRFLSANLSNSCDRSYFLRRIGINEEDIIWPETVTNDSIQANYRNKNPYSTAGMYGVGDLSKLPIFQGGYINFGCWANLSDARLDDDTRAKASELLYKAVTEVADLNEKSHVVDVGCGIGYGCQYMVRRYYPKTLIGLDISPQQVERAANHFTPRMPFLKPEQLRFQVGDAMAMPFFNESLTHVISVEAAQHFRTLDNFVKESQRVLKPSGKLVFSTFFATNAEGRAAIKALIPNYSVHCSDKTVGDVMSSLTEHLRNTHVSSIGKHVFVGLNAWLHAIGYQSQWTILWPALYKAGFVDYFIFQAEKPAVESNAAPEHERMHTPRLS